MRDITSMQIVKEMRLGWNLGNTLDASPTETSWGNPETTLSMLAEVKNAGFNTVRIPVTWQTHQETAPLFDIDETWLMRVEKVVNDVLSLGMYAILNTHHDHWVSLMPSADVTAITERLTRLWTTIASRFKDYDEHVLFETLNEPRTTDDSQWNGGTESARSLLNTYNLGAVNAIRGTGGNNLFRHILIPTHAASSLTNCISDLSIPNFDPKIIVSLHAYYPNDFCFGSASTWGSSGEKAALATEFERICQLLTKKGRAVIIGEWGSVNSNNTAVRVDHAYTFAREASSRGILPIWWDNGRSHVGPDGFGLLDRRASPPKWLFPEIVTALLQGTLDGQTLGR
jgi:aryl-phospho-beta-D-glucosidase BglC (GH1 family)